MEQRAILVTLAGALVALIGISAHLWLRGGGTHPTEPVWELEGDVGRGRDAIVKYGCGACHVIPGIAQARGRVGPQLTDFRHQMYIGGQLANSPANLVRWLRNPQAFAPGTAMPALGLTEAEARDIAAYLYRVP